MNFDYANDRLYDLYQDKLNFEHKEEDEEKKCVNCGAKSTHLDMGSYCNHYCRDAHLDFITNDY